MLRNLLLLANGVGIGVGTTLIIRPAADMPQQPPAQIELVLRNDVPGTASIRDRQDSANDAPGQANAAPEQQSAARESPPAAFRLPARPAVREPLTSAFQPVNSDQTVAQLTAAGFTVARAEWIKSRYDELVAQYNLDAISPEAYWRSPEGQLRRELGDLEFERFLTAQGFRSDVDVVSVAQGLPAALSGFQTYDRIVRYGGKRVFDGSELKALTLEQPPGQPVVVDIIRDGQPMQLVVPGGYLGIALSSRGYGGIAGYVLLR